MGIVTKSYLPLVSATKFDVTAQSIADETDYSGIVGPGSGDCIAYADMPKGRALLVNISTGAAASSPTGLKVGLCESNDANGAGTFIDGTTTEWTNPAGDTQYQIEIPLSYVDDSTKFYNIGVAVKGGGGASLFVGTVTVVLDPTYV